MNRRRVMRAIFATCSEAGINSIDDRIELAKALLDIGEGLESYNELEDDDLLDLLFALKSWSVVQELRLANGILEVEARILLQDSDENSEN